MPLPTHDDAELTRWVKHIISRWKLEHDYRFTIIQALCLGMPMTREDYFRVVRTYCDKATENLKYGRQNDKQPKD